MELIWLEEEIYQFGLRGVINPEDEPNLAEVILQARAGLREHMNAINNSCMYLN